MAEIIKTQVKMAMCLKVFHYLQLFGLLLLTLKTVKSEDTCVGSPTWS